MTRTARLMMGILYRARNENTNAQGRPAATFVAITLPLIAKACVESDAGPGATTIPIKYPTQNPSGAARCFGGSRPLAAATATPHAAISKGRIGST